MLTTSLAAHSQIQVLVVQIGDFPPGAFEQRLALLEHYRVTPIAALTRPSDYDPFSSPLQRFSWLDGTLKFNFVPASDLTRSNYEEFQGYRKTFAAIGMCHCPSTPDLAAAYAQFQELASSFPNARTRRLFAFDHNFDHDAASLDGCGDLDDLVMFPEERNIGDGVSSVSLHMGVVHNTLAVTVLQSFEDDIRNVLKAGRMPAAPALRSVLDDAEEGKKRHTGRMHKWVGDLCTLCSPQDALEHYAHALDMCRASGDHVWYAGALEGTAAATFAWACFQDPSAQPPFLQEVVDMCLEAQAIFARHKASMLDLELSFKVARYLALAQPSRATEAMQQLNRARDVPGLGVQHQILLHIEMANLCHEMGLRRKFALFTRHAALLYEDLQHWPAAHCLGRLATGYYQTAEGGWTLLRHLMLQNLVRLARRLGDHALVARYSADLLTLLGAVDVAPPTPAVAASRSHHSSSISISSTPKRTGRFASIMKAGVGGLEDGESDGEREDEADGVVLSVRKAPGLESQAEIADKLIEATGTLPPNFDEHAMALPHVRGMTLHPPSTTLQPVVRSGGDKDAEFDSGFFFSPFEADRRRKTAAGVQWVQGEVHEVSVCLDNPLSVPLRVQSIHLVARGVPTQCFPSTAELPPHARSQLVALTVKPLAEGELHIDGCTVRAFNMVGTHRVDASGEGEPPPPVLPAPMSYSSERAPAPTREWTGLGPVSVMAAMPVLTVRERAPLLSAEHPLSLLDGQQLSSQLILENAGALPIGFVRIDVALLLHDRSGSLDDEVEDDSIDSEDEEGTVVQVDETVFDSSAGAPADEIGVADGSTERVVAWDVEALLALRESLPLQPHQHVSLPLAILARPDVSGARIEISYASSPEATHCRRVSIPIRLAVVPSLRLEALHVHSLAASLPAELPAPAGRFADTDSDRCIITMTLRNCSTQYFSARGRVDDGDSDDDRDDDELVAARSDFAVPPASVRTVLLPIRRIAEPGADVAGLMRTLLSAADSDSEPLLEAAEAAVRASLLRRLSVRWSSTRGHQGRLRLHHLRLEPDTCLKLLPRTISFATGADGGASPKRPLRNSTDPLVPPEPMTPPITSGKRRTQRHASLPSPILLPPPPPGSPRDAAAGDAAGLPFPLHEFRPLTFVVRNCSSQPLRVRVRVVALQDLGDGTVQLDLGGHVVLSGLLSAKLDLEPGQSAPHTINACFLCAGQFAFALSAEPEELAVTCWATPLVRVDAS